MNNGFSNLNELIINIVVKIRLADTPDVGEINTLYRELDVFCDTYKDKHLVPKKIIHALFILHDILEVMLQYSLKGNSDYFSEFNSRINEYIERLILG